MKVITVAPGSISPVSVQSAAATHDPSAKPLRAKSPGQRATKELFLGKIRSHIQRAKTHIKRGDRRNISPEAMLWVERAVPSETNTLDVLRGIEMILARGVQPLIENQEQLDSLRSQYGHWLTRAKGLWAVGDGGKLPRTAYKAAELDVSEATTDELREAIVGLGGTL